VRSSTPRAASTSTRSCRVQRADGTPLPNLLAAGGAARGVSGNAIWGYLSGNGLLSAVAGGHIAAQTARTLLETA
jgi:fumarate reductase flavoprotein subunit